MQCAAFQIEIEAEYGSGPGVGKIQNATVRAPGNAVRYGDALERIGKEPVGINTVERSGFRLPLFVE
jgi:hypothetical protein